MPTIEEMREELLKVGKVDMDWLKTATPQEIEQVWKMYKLRVGTKTSGKQSQRNDIWSWDLPIIFPSEADVYKGTGKYVEIRGVVVRILPDREYLGCPKHKTKVEELDGKYYCKKCSSFVSPVVYKIKSFIIADANETEMLVSTFPEVESVFSDERHVMSVGDYVAIRGKVSQYKDRLTFDGYDYRVLIHQLNDLENNEVDKVEQEKKVDEKVEEKIEEVEEEEYDVGYDVIRTKLVQMLRRKDLLTFSVIRYVANGVGIDLDEFVTKYFEEVDVDGKKYYKLKQKYREKLEEEGLL